MPQFDPFPGIRYDPRRVRLADVIAPPYDVIAEADRALLSARDPHNAVAVELPVDDPGRSLDRYQAAARTFEEWQIDGFLIVDKTPAFYAYRMRFRGEDGVRRETLGVLGALEVGLPGAGDVLPHEETMPKPKGDRIDLLRATRMNTSPVWGLSLAPGLTSRLLPAAEPLAEAVDADGVQHQLWRVDDATDIDAIAGLVAGAPVVIADGHHRYETALAYRAERRGATGGRPGAYDRVMALVVELAEDQLAVQPIHRLITGLPAGFDLVKAMDELFHIVDAGLRCGEIAQDAGVARALALVTAAGAWLLTPRAELAETADDPELDSSLVAVALSTLPDPTIEYRAGRRVALDAVKHGEAQAAILLRPVTVTKITEMARARRRMPPKTTYFSPKPRTGMVFRSVPG